MFCSPLFRDGLGIFLRLIPLRCHELFGKYLFSTVLSAISWVLNTIQNFTPIVIKTYYVDPNATSTYRSWISQHFAYVEIKIELKYV